MPNDQTLSTLLSAESVNGGKVFADANLIDTTNKTVTVHTCEQLLYAFCLGESGSTVYLDPTELSEDIPAQRGFFFQKYDGLKEGVSGYLFPKRDVNFQVVDGLEYAIIQGLQITGNGFLRGDYGNTLSNLYFKDCVCTLTGDSGVFQYAKFTNCKFSMHIRQGDKTNLIIAQGTWKSCSCYFEFSDLTPDSTSNTGFLTPSLMSESSIIVRNASYHCVNSNSGTKCFQNLTNCSLDVEFYRIYCHSPDLYIGYESINNCFLSIKALSKIGTETPIITFSSMGGVNIINKGTPTVDEQGVIHEDSQIPQISSNSNVKPLTEAECKDYEELNKWGFFTNTASESSNP